MTDEVIKTKETPVVATPVKTYTQGEFEAAVAGLKKNNEALLSEKKEAARIAKEAKDAQLIADQEAAKKSGDLESLEKSLKGIHGKELAERDARLGKLSERILGAERKSVVSAFSNLLIDESASEIIGMMVKTEFDGDEVVTKFVGADGNVITTDPEQFKKYLKEHKAFSHLLKADAATGGGASGSKSRGGATNFASMTLTERAKLANENPALYAQLSGSK